MKGGIDWNLSYLGVDRNPCEFYLMFLSREIDKKNCVKFIQKSVYTKFCIKFVGLDRSYPANTQLIWKRRYHRGA